jgi:SAM-dependent methyltransferase
MIRDILKKAVPPYSYFYFLLLALKSAWDNIVGLGSFKKDFKKFKESQQGSATPDRFAIDWQNRAPYLTDNTSETPVDYHYIYHPAWAARVVAKINPKQHIDISSKLEFSTLLSAFIPVKFYDYRPAPLNLQGLESGRADLMNLPFADNEVYSISCMHTIEHIGLGRYGDAVDYDGDLKAIRELIRVTAPGGNIIFVTPVGQPKIVFNAHRIYSYEQVIEYFSECELFEFSLVNDKGKFITGAEPSLVAEQVYGCGCFWFTKKMNENYSQ